MKNLKTAIWIFAVTLLQSALSVCSPLKGIEVPLLVSLGAAAAFAEDAFGTAYVIGLICGVLEGALFGEYFAMSVMITSVFVLGIINFRNGMRRMNDKVKLFMWTFAAEIFEIGLPMIIKAHNPEKLLYTVISSALGAAAAVVIYILLKKTVYVRKDYKNFIL